MVDTIPQKELRNDVGAVLRRVEAGEHLLVSVAGRTVAELSPAPTGRWVGGATLAAVWSGPAPQDLVEDLAALSAAVVDPFEKPTAP